MGSADVTQADEQLAYTLFVISDPGVVAVFVWFTALGSWTSVLAMLANVTGALLILRRGVYALGLWLTVVGNQVTVTLLIDPLPISVTQRQKVRNWQRPGGGKVKPMAAIYCYPTTCHWTASTSTKLILSGMPTAMTGDCIRWPPDTQVVLRRKYQFVDLITGNLALCANIFNEHDVVSQLH